MLLFIIIYYLYIICKFIRKKNTDIKIEAPVEPQSFNYPISTILLFLIASSISFFNFSISFSIAEIYSFTCSSLSILLFEFIEIFLNFTLSFFLAYPLISALKSSLSLIAFAIVTLTFLISLLAISSL